MNAMSVLYVDEGEISSSFTTFLKNKFDQVSIYKNMYLVESAIDTMKPQVLIIDIGTNQIYSFELFKKIRIKNKFINIVVYTKINNIKTILSFIPLNLQAYLIKTDLKSQIEKSLINVIKESLIGLNKEDGIRLKNKLIWYPKSKKLVKLKRGEEIELQLSYIHRNIFFILAGNKNCFTSREDLMLRIFNMKNANINEASRLRSAFHRLNAKYNENFFESKYKFGYKLRYA